MGFTLIELLVVIAVVGVVSSLLLSSLARSRSRARGVVCLGNLRQLGLAAGFYREDHSGFLPVSAFGRRWVTLFAPVLQNPRVLQCPEDRSMRQEAVATGKQIDFAPRSFLFNGFSDFVAEQFPGKLAVPVRQGLLGARLPDSRVEEPGETLMFGEKASTSDAWELDVFLPNSGFLADLDEARHGVNGHSRRGMSNYVMLDGSSRILPFGESTCPRNLWGITEECRTDRAICRPR